MAPNGSGWNPLYIKGVRGGSGGNGFRPYTWPDEPRMVDKSVEAASDIVDVFRYGAKTTYTSHHNKTMSLSAIAKRVLDSDLNTLVKAGLLTNELELTEAGRRELFAIMFEESKDELVEVAKKVLENRAKEIKEGED